MDRQSPFLSISGLVISVLSIIMASTTLYLTLLRPSNMIINTGDAIEISYGTEGNMGVTMALAYSNTGANPGIVSSVRLRCGKYNSPETTELFPIYYAKLTDGPLDILGIPIPEAVKGGEYVTRTILFWSAADWNKKHDFEIGEYKCDVFARIMGDRRLQRVSRISFSISPDDVDNLKRNKVSNRYIFTHESGATLVLTHTP